MNSTKKKHKKSWFKRKRTWIPLTIILVLLAFRLALPYIVKDYVNKVLSEIPGYQGHVAAIDIALYRGAYVIHDLKLNKVAATSQVPFLSIKKSDISIEWNALFNGEVVSELILYQPKFIYVFEDQQAKGVDPEVEDWTKALTDIVPIDINRLQLVDGTAAFIELQADPNIDLHLKNIDLVAYNLRNVVQKERNLPSEVHATAISIGEGDLELDGRLNLVKQIPDMDIAFELTNANATALNDFTTHYAGIDFNKGTFEIFGEIAIADGYLKGSIKPILTNAKLLGKEDGFLNSLWEGFVGFFKFLFKNQKHNTLATKVPIEGNLNNAGAKIWPTVTNIFKNAWVKAYKGILDDDIDFKDAEEAVDDKNK